ncbi:peptide MFS transporter [Lichenicoccus roseus]|uniref:MFS transporter n=1 Tax=Lichenicoccus roseus TaxID=2683649 RepID=A0A5R9J5V3_9PROT|nr:oligopeptide:H+ symporter [Lichenicoccus roseus]TLU70991.1 MFS transporter [Lichenicoccus roseus]
MHAPAIPQPLAPSTVTRTQSFTVVLLIELWERFGYYGMQAILLLFMVQQLGFSDARSNLLWGAFAALTYAAPAVGGWIGDRVLGSRRTMLLGAITLTIGYLLMAWPTTGTVLLYAAMGTISVGNGLFKSNAANMVRRIYEGDDSRLDGAFTIYYMAVNVGSTVSILLCPWLKDRYGWHVAFGMCCAGLVLGLVNYAIMHRRVDHIGSVPDGQPLRPALLAAIIGGALGAIVVVGFVLQHAAVARACVWLAGAAVVAIWIWTYARSAASERPGLLMMYLLTVQSMVFFIFYQQMSTSLTLFALRNVQLEFNLAGVALFHWSAGQFQALNPIWIMLASPPLALLYNRLGATGRDVSLATKFLLGFACVAGGFLVWWLSCRFATSPLISPWVMVWGYGLLSLGELLVSGLGLAVVARYVPGRMSAFMMGAYFVSTGVAMYLGSAVANLAAVPDLGGAADPAQSLPIYTTLFFRLFLAACVGTGLFALLLPVSRKLDRAHNYATA